MTAKVVRRPAALLDLDIAADFIRIQSGPDRAIRFLRAADATITQLAQMPGIGTRYEAFEPIYANIRFFPITRHRKFLVFYRPIPGGVEIFRVLHGARDIQGILAEEFGDTEDEDLAAESDDDNV